MLAVVKTPHTKKETFEVKGDIPNNLMAFLRSEFGNNLIIIDNKKDYVDITKTAWYKRQKANKTLGKTVRIYRERDNLTQAELGQKLGGLSIQKISDIEHDRRGISKDSAKKLAHIFGTSVEKFL